MSRSKRHSPFIGAGAGSDKKDKQRSHRRIRRAIHQALADGEEDVFPEERELTTPWEMTKDGKVQFNPDRWPELMRK